MPFVHFLSSQVATVDYSAIKSTMQSTMSDLATNCLGVLTVILPAGISVFGAVMIIGYSKKLFKKITG